VGAGVVVVVVGLVVVSVVLGAGVGVGVVVVVVGLVVVAMVLGAGVGAGAKVVVAVLVVGDRAAASAAVVTTA